MSPVYTREEVRKHNNEKTLWMVIHNDVYDVTKFLNEHPGGADSLKDFAGKDGTVAFENVGHSDDARGMMAKFKIGTVPPGEQSRHAVSWSELPMPLIKSCGCFSLKTGCLILCVISTLLCVANITAGAWNLPRHRSRDPEDNLISLSMVMFSSLSAVSNIIALFGIWLKRSSNLQLSLMSNCVFILCILLVELVTCIFRMEKYFEHIVNVFLAILLLLAGAAYSVFYLMVVNSYYRTMKMSYGESAIPMSY